MPITTGWIIQKPYHYGTSNYPQLGDVDEDSKEEIIFEENEMEENMLIELY